MKRALLLALAALGWGCALLTDFSGIDDGTRAVDSDASGERDAGPLGDSAPGASPDASRLADTCNDAGQCAAVLTQGRGRPLGIAVAGDFVYWVETDTASLWRADRQTGEASRIDQPADAVEDPFDIAVDGPTLYWTERRPARIGSRPLAGGPRVDLAATGATALAFLAVAKGTAFASDFVASKPTTGHVYTATKVSGGLWVDQPSVVAGVGVQFDLVTWTQAPTGALLQSPTASASAVYVGYPVGATSGLGFDGRHAFVVEDERKLVRVDTTDGARVEVFDFAANIGDGDVAVDAQYVYVTEPARGIIERVKRP